LQGYNPSTRELGHVIVAANGQPTRRLADLAEQVEQVGVGKTIELVLMRGSSQTSRTVEVVDIEIRPTPSGLGAL
jgi:2-alkenal reductase